MQEIATLCGINDNVAIMCREEAYARIVGRLYHTVLPQTGVMTLDYSEITVDVLTKLFTHFAINPTMHEMKTAENAFSYDAKTPLNDRRLFEKGHGAKQRLASALVVDMVDKWIKTVS